MRLRISLPDEVVTEIDHRVEVSGRSTFIARAVEQALEDDRSWDLVESVLGSVRDGGHEWDDDPAAWVRAQRR